MYVYLRLLQNEILSNGEVCVSNSNVCAQNSKRMCICIEFRIQVLNRRTRTYFSCWDGDYLNH